MAKSRNPKTLTEPSDGEPRTVGTPLWGDLRSDFFSIWKSRQETKAVTLRMLLRLGIEKYQENND